MVEEEASAWSVPAQLLGPLWTDGPVVVCSTILCLSEPSEATRCLLGPPSSYLLVIVGLQ